MNNETVQLRKFDGGKQETKTIPAHIINLVKQAQEESCRALWEVNSQEKYLRAIVIVRENAQFIDKLIKITPLIGQGQLAEPCLEVKYGHLKDSLGHFPPKVKE